MAWSYSAWELWKKCPLASKYRRVDKLKSKPSPAMARGLDIHTNIENYLTDKTKTLTSPGCNVFIEGLKAKRKVQIEKPWAVDINWTPTTWFADNVWLRAKLDASYKKSRLLNVLDFKTGRVYPSHEDQASLYATISLGFYSKISNVQVGMWYLDQNKIENYKWSKKDLRIEKLYWHEQGAKMLADTKYKPNPCWNSCKWCDYRSDKQLANGAQGPCDLWRQA